MRDYSQFKSSFWTGETGRALRADPEAQRLAAYLFTSPHHNLIGFYWLPVLYASSEVGMSEEGVEAALQRLSDMGFAHYDKAHELVWVVNMAREQLGLHDGARLAEKDNRGKAARKAADAVKKSALYPKFFAAYGAALGLGSPKSPPEPPCKGVETASEERRGKEGREKGKGRENIQGSSLGAAAPVLPANAQADPEPPIREQVLTLEARYSLALCAETRAACALSRRNGKMADTVWLNTLKAMAGYRTEAVESAMRTFAERYADGQRDERYLIGIARSNHNGAPERAGRIRGGILRPAPAEAFEDTPVSAYFDDAEGM